MTRARFVMGLPAMASRFDAVRHAVIGSPRDAASLKAEIVAMRDRVRQGHPVKADRFDVKHSPGAMVDAEFAMQYLVLLHTATHPELADNVGNIALLQRAEKAALLPPGVGQAAANAYREMRRVQHRARLNEEPTDVPLEVLAVERDAVLVLWRFVMG
jgi:glutamate-ammonia-ligase adenylyltransferase